QLKCFLIEGGFLSPKTLKEWVSMRHVSTKVGRSKARGLAVGAGLICVYLMGALPGGAQVTASVRELGSDSPARLLNAEEGRSIADAAWEQNELPSGARDCSHFVHQVYL